MHICFIVEGYPYTNDPYFAFIREVVVALANCGHVCTIIAPQSLSRAIKRHLKVRPIHWKDETDKGFKIDVIQPIYFSFSHKFERIVRFYKNHLIRVSFKRLKNKVDVLYAHFWHLGLSASKIKTDIPLVIACGESEIIVQDIGSSSDISHLLERIKGVIYVSKANYDESKRLCLQNDSLPYIIAPNGYNPKQFYKIDKKELRKKMCWQKDWFVVCYLGAFNDRKGASRLSEAINRLNNDNIYSCFIGSDDGSGESLIDCKNILFKGKLNHDEINNYLCASDVFVLPTKNEGCCNAIIEAIACGLPIISSDLPFNDGILDETNSIRIDPNSIEQISLAIDKLLKNKDLLDKLSSGSFIKASSLSIEKRAIIIGNFIAKLTKSS